MFIKLQAGSFEGVANNVVLNLAPGHYKGAIGIYCPTGSTATSAGADWSYSPPENSDGSNTGAGSPEQTGVENPGFTAVFPGVSVQEIDVQIGALQKVVFSAGAAPTEDEDATAVGVLSIFRVGD